MAHLVRDAANYSPATCKQAVDLGADHSGMPALETTEAFVRGVDIILGTQQEFLGAVVNPSESAKAKIFGAAK